MHLPDVGGGEHGPLPAAPGGTRAHAERGTASDGYSRTLKLSEQFCSDATLLEFGILEFFTTPEKTAATILC